MWSVRTKWVPAAWHSCRSAPPPFRNQSPTSALTTAKTWYGDGTFKVVRQTFAHLLPFHAFFRSGREMKQVQFAFVLICRRHTPTTSPSFEPVVQECSLDFKAAMWNASRRVLPALSLRGHYHYKDWIVNQYCGSTVLNFLSDKSFSNFQSASMDNDYLKLPLTESIIDRANITEYNASC